MPGSAPQLVHPVPAEEIDGWVRSLSATFLHEPAGEDLSRRIETLRRTWSPERAWGARDRGRWVATLLTEPRRLTVPGRGTMTGEVEVDALTAVTVAGTNRRQGLMSAMLTDSLRAARERGDPLSVLIAAEWPIYGRFGYAPATLRADWTLRRLRRGSAIAGDLIRVRQVDREEFGEVAAAVFAAARAERAGQMNRDQTWWDRVLGRDGYPGRDGLPHNWLVHDGDDGPDGLLSWTGSDYTSLVPPMGSAEVGDLVTVGDAAYRDLWAYLSGLDGTDEIRIGNRPVDEPARWLLPDGRTLVMTEQVDFLWVRILDAPAALSARRYAARGEVVLEVVDDDGDGFAAGRWRLTAEGDDARCEGTASGADLRITQRALAAIYLGGFRLAELGAAGGISELTPGAITRTAAMFATPLAPWNATWF